MYGDLIAAIEAAATAAGEAAVDAMGATARSSSDSSDSSSSSSSSNSQSLRGSGTFSRLAAEMMQELEVLNVQFAANNAEAAASLAAVEQEGSSKSPQWLENERQRLLRRWLLKINIQIIQLSFLYHKAAGLGVPVDVSAAAATAAAKQQEALNLPLQITVNPNTNLTYNSYSQ